MILFVALAVWRLSHMLVHESGPLQVLERLRAALAQRQKHPGGLYDLLSCVNCTSVWVSMLFALIISRNLAEFVVFVLSLSAVAMLIELFVKKVS